MSATDSWDDGPLSPVDVHTAKDFVPWIGYDLEAALKALTGLHPGLDLICDGYRLLATDRHTLDTTQTVITGLDGSDESDTATLNRLVMARLTHPDTNPALRPLPDTALTALREEADRYQEATTPGQAAAAAAELAGLLYEAANDTD